MSNIRALRQQMNLSQKALAELLCLDQTTISKWEKGISQPDIETAIKLSGVFNVSLDTLFSNPHRQVFTELPLCEAVYANCTYTMSHHYVPFMDIGTHASDIASRFFAATVVKENMAPHIRYGSIAIVEKSDQFANEKLLFVCIGENMGQVFCGYIAKECKLLVSYNPRVAPIIVTDERHDIQILGHVLEIRTQW